MQIGINLLLWTAQPGPEHAVLFTHLGSIGYDLVELPVFEPARFPAPALRTILADAGLTVTCTGALPAGASLIGSDRQAAQRASTYLYACIDVAAALGASLLSGPFYHPVGAFSGVPPTEAERQRFIERLQPVADYAAAAGVRLAVEPLNRFETYFLNTLHDGARIVRDLAHPAVGLLADTFHQHIEEDDSARAFSAVGDVLFHVHASENQRGCPGRGQVAWSRVAATLDAIGYDGAVVVESFGGVLPELVAATRIWRDVGGDPFTLAAEAVVFLDSLFADRSDRGSQ